MTSDQQEEMLVQAAGAQPTAFVTGASRGIGAQTCLALAAAGWDVALGYEAKTKRVREVAARIERLGGRSTTIGGDLTDPHDRTRFAGEVRAWTPHLAALVLNASGGLDQSGIEGRPANALTTAQVDLATAFANALAPGGTIVYVTSHWAHLNAAANPVPRQYHELAANKHHTERALRNMQPWLLAPSRAIRLIVVTGGLVTGTFIGDQTVRRFPEFASEQAAIANVVTAEQMGGRIARVIGDSSLPSGHTEVVGAPLAALSRAGRANGSRRLRARTRSSLSLPTSPYEH